MAISHVNGQATSGLSAVIGVESISAIIGVSGGLSDVTPPELVSATIEADGDTWTLVFSENVNFGAGGNGGFVPDMSGGAVTLSYDSGEGTDTLVYTGDRTIDAAETGTIDYTQPGNGVEDTAGNDLASIGSAAVTNNSTQVCGGPTLIDEDNFDSYAHNSMLHDSGSAAWAQMVGNVFVHKPSSDGALYATDTQGHCRNTSTFSSDQRAEATLYGALESFAFGCISVRCQSGANTRYQLQFDGDIYYLIAFVAGVQNIVHNGLTLDLNIGDKVALEASGSGSATRLKIQKDIGGGWVDVSSNIDPGAGNYIDGGSPGAGAANTGPSKLLVDDWKGYDI